MKYVVVLGDGMPDYPLEVLGGKTPLQYARTPWMDRLAQKGELGMVKSIPDNLPAGSDVANLSVLGYDPVRYYTGRAPIEAVAMDVKLAPGDTVFRCNLVTLSTDVAYTDKVMLDYSAGEIDTSAAHLLMDELNRRLGNARFRFYGGISYRHLMVWRDGPQNFNLTPPHDIFGKVIRDYLPSGAESDILRKLMMESSVFLGDNPVNRQRMARGQKPANSIWFWGQGRKLELDSFYDKYGLNGAVVSVVDLIKGLALSVGLEAVQLPGAPGDMHTDFRGRTLKALEKLRSGLEFVFIHVEAPDEAGHHGDLQTKVKAIEAIDENVVGEVLRGLNDFPQSRLMVLSDHPTPIPLRTHTAAAVPYCIYSGTVAVQNASATFCEEAAKNGPYFPEGHLLMGHFLKRTLPLC
ncbi:MAG TPA: cofactor-independent phosphoglycerate mutase [Firmicutes bacterium]|nr:cofactor-independent phosphoglycerate mutase [Bacillota bacterium]